MNEPYSAELFRQDGREFRAIRLYVRPDGAVKMEAQDIGDRVRQVWGDDDYEFWVDAPAAALRKLAFALIREKYAGRSGAVDEFRAFCQKEQIEHQWGSWA